MALVSKTPKQCMFCGHTGQITKEHAWPQWLGRGAQVAPIQSTRTIGFGRTAVDVLTEAPNRIVNKPGSVLTTRIREVCGDCNNGWMSQLESAARPVLERLWAPSYPFGRTTINRDQAATVAAWATKTAWVRERVDGPKLTSTPEMRQYLANRREPPEFTNVWVARHQGLSNFGAWVARLQTTHEDDHWDGAARRHVLICTMAFRGLALVVRTDSGWGVPQMELAEHTWRRLWPIAESVQWPPAQPASDDDVRAVAGQFTGWLKLPEARFEQDGSGWDVINRN